MRTEGREMHRVQESENGGKQKNCLFLGNYCGWTEGVQGKRRERRQERWTKMGEERGRGTEREAASLQYFIC